MPWQPARSEQDLQARLFANERRSASKVWTLIQAYRTRGAARRPGPTGTTRHEDRRAFPYPMLLRAVGVGPATELFLVASRSGRRRLCVHDPARDPARAPACCRRWTCDGQALSPGGHGGGQALAGRAGCRRPFRSGFRAGGGGVILRRHHTRRRTSSASSRTRGQQGFSLEGDLRHDDPVARLAKIIERAACRMAREGRDRDGSPRPPERAREHHGQVPRADLPRVRGRPPAALLGGLGRRQVPPRPERHLPDPRRQRDRGRPLGEPQSPRGGRPGRVRHDARLPGRHRGHRPRSGPGRAHPRRRGLLGPGRRARDAQRASELAPTPTAARCT